ncbi:MAG: ATP-dependent helicase HrpB [Deltaproteobacteria bacterium]|nr:ATP-dependent helicase HrpB [Deltaproteobacteria bacterium]
MNTLPIDNLLPEILKKIQHHQSLVIQASPGSGKTTRIPPALLHSKILQENQEVWVLVPRRLAAKFAALRVAQELGEEVGEQVGYHFRFEKRIGPKTRLKFFTEGMLLRLLAEDPLAFKAGIIILDEFHERHLHTDLALSYLVHLQKTKRPDLKLLILSATLDEKPLLSFLPNSYSLRLETALYETRLTYLSKTSDEPLDKLIKKAVLEALKIEQGKDLLVFLPGMSEIRKCQEILEREVKSEPLDILPLHGDLAKETQALIFEPGKRRKIILSTNIAESSLTLENVNIVIDSGLRREASFSWWTGLAQLQTKNISQASAIQRCGRSSRTSAGYCFRLYTLGQFQAWPAYDTAEIEKTDLSQSILELKNLGLQNLHEHFWFKSPPAVALQHATELLFYLGALSENNISSALTSTGRQMARIPLSPRLSRLMLTAQEEGITEKAALIAASLSEGFLTDLDIFSIFERRLPENVEKVKTRIIENVKIKPEKNPGRGRAFQNTPQDIAKLRHCLLSAFPDHVAQKRKTNSEPGQNIALNFCNGGSALAPRHLLTQSHDFFIVLEAQENRDRVQVKSLCVLEEEDLLSQETWLHEKTILTWDTKSLGVSQKSGFYYGDLILNEQWGTPSSIQEAQKIFLEKVFQLSKPEQSLDIHQFIEKASRFEDKIQLENLLGRLEVFFDKKISTISFKELENILEGVYQLKQVQDLPFSKRLMHWVSPQKQLEFDQKVPLYWEKDRKKKFKIHYRLGQAPYLEARLQDFWGIQETPKIKQGEIALTLHLLAPNGRPLQVTQDLKSFWEKTYPDLKKQLSRRYPKHPWP